MNHLSHVGLVFAPLALAGCSCSNQSIENGSRDATETAGHVVIGAADGASNIVSDPDNQKAVENTTAKLTRGTLKTGGSIIRGVRRGVEDFMTNEEDAQGRSFANNSAAPVDP